MTNNKKFYVIITAFLVLTGVGALVFYFYKTPQINSISPPVSDNFIQSVAQSPAVEGNVVNSGIAGRVVLLGGGPYEYEASLEIYKTNDSSKPFISIRTHDDGSFQVPLKPGSYVLKPMDPDGPIAPVRENYPFTIGDGQWLQVRVEYNSSISE